MPGTSAHFQWKTRQQRERVERYRESFGDDYLSQVQANLGLLFMPAQAGVGEFNIDNIARAVGPFAYLGPAHPDPTQGPNAKPFRVGQPSSEPNAIVVDTASAGYLDKGKQHPRTLVDSPPIASTLATPKVPTVGETAATATGRIVSVPRAAHLPKIPSALKSASCQFWTETVEFQGSKVYQRDDLIDLTLTDSMGRTNLQRMQAGRAPIGPDGESLNLHHMLQTQGSPLAEMTQAFHQKKSSIIHINPHTLPSAINRSTFNTFRAQYWTNRAVRFGGGSQ